MNRQWIIPSISMCLNLGSACVYASRGDLRRAIYWTAAAIITGSVTF